MKYVIFSTLKWEEILNLAFLGHRIMTFLDSARKNLFASGLGSLEMEVLLDDNFLALKPTFSVYFFCSGLIAFLFFLCPGGFTLTVDWRINWQVQNLIRNNKDIDDFFYKQIKEEGHPQEPQEKMYDINMFMME